MARPTRRWLPRRRPDGEAPGAGRSPPVGLAGSPDRPAKAAPRGLGARYGQCVVLIASLRPSRAGHLLAGRPAGSPPPPPPPQVKQTGPGTSASAPHSAAGRQFVRQFAGRALRAGACLLRHTRAPIIDPRSTGGHCVFLCRLLRGRRAPDYGFASGGGRCATLAAASPIRPSSAVVFRQRRLIINSNETD